MFIRSKTMRLDRERDGKMMGMIGMSKEGVE
jgi:hypothetical protein